MLRSSVCFVILCASDSLPWFPGLWEAGGYDTKDETRGIASSVSRRIASHEGNSRTSILPHGGSRFRFKSTPLSQIRTPNEIHREIICSGRKYSAKVIREGRGILNGVELRTCPDVWLSAAVMEGRSDMNGLKQPSQKPEGIGARRKRASLPPRKISFE